MYRKFTPETLNFVDIFYIWFKKAHVSQNKMSYFTDFH